MTEKHRLFIFIVVAAVGICLIGFWFWAMPVILAPSGKAIPFFSAFRRELNKMQKETVSAWQDFAVTERQNDQAGQPALSADDLEKIKTAVEEVNHQTESLPKLPEAEAR